MMFSRAKKILFLAATQKRNALIMNSYKRYSFSCLRIPGLHAYALLQQARKWRGYSYVLFSITSNITTIRIVAHSQSHVFSLSQISFATSQLLLPTFHFFQSSNLPTLSQSRPIANSPCHPFLKEPWINNIINVLYYGIANNIIFRNIEF